MSSRIPLARPIDSADGPARSSCVSEIESDPALTDAERRLEDWLVSHLDDKDRPNDPRSTLESLLTTGPVHRKTDPGSLRTPARGPSRGSGTGWAKLRVSKSRGITLVRFPDSRLLREDDLRTVAEELTALVRAGHHRLVLNFAGVERMSSQIVGAVAVAHRRCAAVEGGQLRLCGLLADLSELFALTGLAGPIAIFPDERAALDAPWPPRPGLRPLPISLLAALSRRVAASEEDGDATSEAPLVTTDDATETPRLRLVALTPRSRGRSVAVGSSPFVIGRDRSCQLHADWPAISRRHAAIEQVEGGWQIRDLASTNGSFLNGTLLRDGGQLLSEGDEIRVGPLRFAVLLGDNPAPRNLPDDVVASWLRDEETDDPTDALTAEGDVKSERSATDQDTTSGLKVDVIEGVLVLTPRLTYLETDPSLEVLRSGLSAALPGPTARQVVINLEYVAALSSRAVGLLMATFLRLDREGGSLRLCQPTAPVHALLDQLRLPMLVPVFSSLDEAVLNVWA